MANLTISAIEPATRDAWLIECCRELLELEAENDRLYVPVAAALPGDPVIDAWARFNDRTRDRRLELSSTIHENIRDDGRGAPCQGARRYKAIASTPEDWGAYSLAVNILQWMPEPPTRMTAEEKAKDGDFACRIDELAALWSTFTPPARQEEGAGA
jgi:hypothetical protein